MPSIGPTNTRASGYQPLDPSGKEIRIITIVSAPENDQRNDHSTIICRSEVIKFDDNSSSPRSYRAFSYTWGSRTKSILISLDGHAFPVTENLAIVLQHLAKTYSQTKFWIDAICINQENEGEKSTQVAMMGAIFKKAIEVVVWLGPSEDGSVEAIATLRQIGEACQNEFHSDGEVTSSTAMSQEHNVLKKTEKATLSTIRCRWFPKGSPIFNLLNISRIFQRPWFRRVWVLQEAAVNDQVIFHCGSETISKAMLWAGGRTIIELTNDVFNQTGSWIAHDPLWQTLSGANFISRRTMDLIRSGMKDFTLEQLLLETSANLGEWSYEASEARDRVYAIMGLASDLSTLGLDSDYETPCKDVYNAAAETILKNSTTVDILYAVNWPKNVQAMPSWVPDWTTSTPASFGLRQMGRFSASGKDSRATSIFTTDQFGNRILALQGYKFDMLTEIFPQFYESSHKSDSYCQTVVHDIVNLLKELTHIKTEAYSTPYLRTEAFWRAPIADCDAVFDIKYRYRPVATERMRQSYNALMSLSSGDASWDVQTRAYLHVMKLVSARRRLFVSERGYIGLGADEMRSGDMVCLLLGGDSPMILRETALGNYQLVGEAYVHGIMHGEFLVTNPILQEFRLC